MTSALRIVVAGAGVFGVTAALALCRRGHRVTLCDPGPLPHPLAESTDLSKVVRLDYGADEDYLDLAEQALDGWRRWNAAWPAPLFHETGVLFLARAAFSPGGFEHDSYQLLCRRGHRPERLDGAALARRFPSFQPGVHRDAYFNPEGGWVEASAVMTRLLAEAAAAGVAARGAVTRLTDGGVALADGAELAADRVVVAAGSWTPHLVPALAPLLRRAGQPVFHLATAAAADLPVFCADIARTGYYGFPRHPSGVVKIAHHGAGRAVPPGSAVDAAEDAALAAFVAETLPGLAVAPIVHRRLCVYSDTVDGDLVIAADPARPGVVVACGGSGHAFKFAPVLGDLIADAVEGATGRWARRFRWRTAASAAAGAGDAARLRTAD